MRYSKHFFIVVAQLCGVLFPLYCTFSQESQFLEENRDMSSMEVNNLISKYSLSYDYASDTLFAYIVALREYGFNDDFFSEYTNKKLYLWFSQDSATKAQFLSYQDKIGLSQSEKDELYSRVIIPISEIPLTEQAARRLNGYFIESKNDIDSLLSYLLDYYIYGFHYEGYSEYIGQCMQELFYKNNTLGKRFDSYMAQQNISPETQDTIRIRMMFDIVCHLILLNEEKAENPLPINETLPLPPANYSDYPYFNSHNNILNHLSLYLKYY